MKVTVERESGCRRRLRIEVDRAVVDAELGRVTTEYAQAVTLPGFRKGRAPAAVVERHLSADIAEEARKRLVSDACRDALQAEKIDPVGVVGVQNVAVEKGAPLVFTVTVDVVPEFSLPNYRGLALTGRSVAVPDTEVEAAIERIRNRAATFVEAAADTPAAKGDMVQVNYSATCNGTPVKKLVPGDAAVLGEGQGVWMAAGEPGFIPGLEGVLLGIRKGETRKAAVKFPADFRVAALAGHEGTYALAATAVRSKALPELNEEFAKQFGATTVEDLKAKARSGLQRAAEEQDRTGLKDEISRILVESTAMELPESVVQDETRHIVRDVVTENTMRGVPRQRIEEHREDIVGAAEKSSQARVKLTFILDRIADKENIKVEPAEMDAHLASLALRYGTEKEALKADLEKNDAVSGMERSLRASKTLDFILASAVVKRDQP